MNKTQKLGEFLQGLLYKVVIFGAISQIGEKWNSLFPLEIVAYVEKGVKIFSNKYFLLIKNVKSLSLKDSNI